MQRWNVVIFQKHVGRANEIFKLKATPVDIHNLPFKDNEFDVVICSETLEHVTESKLR